MEIKLTRYDGPCQSYMEECARGDYVLYEDAIAEIEAACAVNADMLTALETVLAGGHLNTGEQAIVANAIAKALGISIDEVLRVGG